jgi:hypothetical protein
MLDEEQDKDSRKERDLAIKRAEDAAYRVRFGKDLLPEMPKEEEPHTHS